MMNVVQRCRHGLMIYNQRDVWQGRSFEVYGEYSEAEVQLYTKIIKNGDTVIEVGGNIGSLTVPISRLTGTGVVMTFEPERTAFCTLAGNIAINNLRNVFCYQQAIGKTTGVIDVPELDLERTDNFGGLELDKDYTKCPHYPVGLNSIDAIDLQHCDIIKIDVEGMEMAVLEGAVKTIEKLSPHLVVEDDRPEKSEALRAFIRSQGYKMYLHEAMLFNPNNWNGIKQDVFGNIASINLFCHKKEIAFDPVVDFGMKLVP